MVGVGLYWCVVHAEVCVLFIVGVVGVVRGLCFVVVLLCCGGFVSLLGCECLGFYLIVVGVDCDLGVNVGVLGFGV